MPCFSRVLLALAALVVFTPLAHAAGVTQVASSFDDDNPFDLKLELGWMHTWQSTKITRENRQSDSSLGADTIVDVTELQYKRTSNEFRPTIRAGLYKDFEFFFTWPYVFRDSQNWGPADLVGLPQSSTLHNTAGICADGRIDESCREALFPFEDGSGSNNSYRAGLDNGTVGFRWGILNEERHPWSPRWVVGAGWGFPMVTQRQPTLISHAPDNPAPIADRVNRWTFETAVSRQVGDLIDPFVRFHYTLPHARRNAFHNCDQSASLADMDRQTDGVQNTCEGSEWTENGSNRGALSPAHVGGMEFGAEILPYVDVEQFVRVAVQISAGAAFVSEGRDYTILSDAMQRLTYHEEYGHLHGTLGIRAQASRYAKFNALFTLAHDTPYLLTRETIGRDLTGSGVVDLTYTSQDITIDERNPNFDFRWDQPGRRFRAEETSYFTLFLMGELNF